MKILLNGQSVNVEAMRSEIGEDTIIVKVLEGDSEGRFVPISRRMISSKMGNTVLDTKKLVQRMKWNMHVLITTIGEDFPKETRKGVELVNELQNILEDIEREI